MGTQQQLDCLKSDTVAPNGVLLAGMIRLRECPPPSGIEFAPAVHSAHEKFVILAGVIGLAFTAGCFDLRKSNMKLADGGEIQDTDNPAQECHSCTKTSCGNALESCSKDLFCIEMQQCVEDCQRQGSSTSQCDESCLQPEYNWGLHTDVSLCQGRHCADSCQRQCGGFTYRFDGCGICMQSKCCDHGTACSEEPACLGMINCLADCTPGDWGCFHDCYQTLEPDKLVIFEKYQICFANACFLDCGIGKRWDCVGDTKDINLVRRDTTLRLGFADISNSPIQGVSVRMCQWSDPDCANPLVSGTSGSDGFAELTYEVDPATMMRVRFEISKPGRVPAELTYSRPLTYGPLISHFLILPTAEELEFLASYVGIDIDDNRGHAFFYFMDCTMTAGKELVLSAPDIEGATLFYVRNWLPDKAADRTSNEGAAGIFNLPAETVRILAAPFESNDSPVLSKTVQIRPGSISFAVVWPQ